MRINITLFNTQELLFSILYISFSFSNLTANMCCKILVTLCEGCGGMPDFPLYRIYTGNLKIEIHVWSSAVLSDRETLGDLTNQN